MATPTEHLNHDQVSDRSAAVIQKEKGQNAAGPYDPAREGMIRKVTWVGLVANVLLAGFKFLAGIIGSSQAGAGGRCHSQPYRFDDRYCRHCGLALLVATAR